MSLEANGIPSRRVRILRCCVCFTLLRRLHVPHLDEAPRGGRGALPPLEDTHACGETASPHVVIAVVISSSGGGAGHTKPRQAVRQTCQGRGWGVCGVVRTNRGPQPGGPQHDGCSPHAWRSCFWCGSAGCSRTP